jgi:hypothetical protein
MGSNPRELSARERVPKGADDMWLFQRRDASIRREGLKLQLSFGERV